MRTRSFRLNQHRFTRLNDDAAHSDLLDEPRLVQESGVALAVARIATPVLRDLGFRLVRVKLSGQDGTTLQIMAERPDGTMDVDGCEQVSDALSPVLDVEDPIKGEYRLEISSPGIDRPLMRVSDYRRAIGFEAKVELTAQGALAHEGRRRFRGRIDGLDEAGTTPVLLFTRSDAKPEEADEVRLALSDLDDGRLILTDDLVRASLRAAKAAAENGSANDEADPGSDEAEGEAADEPGPPAKGPGRFALRNAARPGRAGKPKPLLPAGVRGEFKKTNPRAPKPR